MALKDIPKIDNKIIKLYEDKVTTNTTNENFVDHSEDILKQMTFIALNNKSFFKF